MFQGNKVWGENSDHALFAELGSSPASMEAGKIIDVYGSQPRFTKQQADARQAYTQALFKGTETWVRLPRNRWPKSWSGMKGPVAPLRLALYGHPDSGGIWEQRCTKELTKVGFVAVLPDIWPSVFHQGISVACTMRRPKSNYRSLRRATRLQLLRFGMKIIGILILRTRWPLSIMVTLVSVCMFPPRTMFPCSPL